MKPLLLCIGCVLVWASWPIMARKSGLSTHWINLIVTGVTFISVLIWFLLTPKESLRSPQYKGAVIMLIAGVLNGVGMILYGYLLENKSAIQVSTYVPLISALMPISTMAFCYLILGERITTEKIMGAVVIFVGIYLITKK